MRAWLTGVLLSGWLATPGLAETVADYGYPLADPLEATVIGTPGEYRADLPEEIPFELREVRPFPDRDVPAIFWYTGGLRYLLAAQPGGAPLAFIIPGAGANFAASQSVTLQQILYQAGFHVAALPSPLHPNFIVSASSSGRPGLLAEDAQDIYRVMELIRDQIGAELDITGYRLAGYSLGGTYAAFVARLDEERGSFDFERVLLINPPVDLARAAETLDAMFERHIRSLADFDLLFHRLMTAVSAAYQPGDQMRFGADLLYDLFRTSPFEDTTLEALIGIAFRLGSIDLVFSSDVMSNAGLLVARDHEIGITESLTPYFKAASQLSFEDYAREILLPWYRERVPGASLQQLAEQNSLPALEDYLREAEHIGLIHNADDILLDNGDIEWLKDVFGPRARIYPRGGHLGNLPYLDNVAYTIDFFVR
jgi:hypothetical protein